MPTPSDSAPAPAYAVALFPGVPGVVCEVRVLVLDLFGAPSLSDSIGAYVRAVDSAGVPRSGSAFAWFLPAQRLIAARTDAEGRRTIPARELAEKREAYAARLAAGDTRPAFIPASRRKPRLVDAPETTLRDPDVENDAERSSAEPPMECRSWAIEHERHQEEAAA